MRIILVCLIVVESLLGPAAYSYDAGTLGFFTVPERELSMAVLTLQESGTDAALAEQVADDVRERLINEQPGQVLSKEKTQEILAYYRPTILQGATISPVGKNLEEAKRAYFDSKFKDAEKLLNDALDLSQRQFQETGVNDSLIDIRILRAHVFKALREEGKLQKEFDEAAKLDPTLNLDPKFFSPWAIREFNKAKKEVLSKGSGSLEIQSDPPSGHVFLNGVPKGETPTSLNDLPPGRHSIKILADNYAPIVRVVEIDKGEDKLLDLKLDWIPPKGDSDITGFQEQDCPDLESLARIGKAAGISMGVVKVLFVSIKSEGKSGQIIGQLVDIPLGTVQPKVTVPVASFKEFQPELATLVAQVDKKAQIDLMKKPGATTEDRAIGETVLIGERRELYKSPWFWVGVAALTGTGIGAGIAASGGAVAVTTGGVLIGL